MGKMSPKQLDTMMNAIAGVTGVILIGIGIPLTMDKIAPNSWYGFRTEKTLSNPTIWYAANRVAGWDLIIAGIVITIVSVILWKGASRLAPGKKWLIAMGVLFVVVGAAIAHCFYYLSTL